MAIPIPLFPPVTIAALFFSDMETPDDVSPNALARSRAVLPNPLNPPVPQRQRERDPVRPESIATKAQPLSGQRSLRASSADRRTGLQSKAKSLRQVARNPFQEILLM